ncbi:hypothetical protein [Corynebacterium auriscanis]|uniref:hypothetical protein n=1 Tax=Corynebacterium auriscanis TaxID=99807 RepID=UPI003CF31C73
MVVSPVWRDASTPTLAATMDAMVKAVQAKIFPMGSEIVLDRIGVSSAEKAVLRREWAHQQASQRLVSLTSQGLGESVRVPVSGDVGVDEFVSGEDSSGL